ncbi:MAG: GntR family transcriptional regulator [Acidobacteriota bacterium]
MKRQLKLAVASGRLQPGDALSSVRELAVTLRVNRNTVAKAYRELEQERVVETRRGHGTFVAQRTAWLAEPARLELLTGRVDALVAEAFHLSVEPEQLLALVRERLGRLGEEG